MNDRPRARLVELVRLEGSALLGNPKRVHESLQAACPDCPGEVMALSAAMRQGLPGSIISAAANPGTQWAEFGAGWVQRLQTAEQMPPDYAAWAVDSWAMALGIAIAPFSAASAKTFAPSGAYQIPPVAPPAPPFQPPPLQPSPAVPYGAPPAGYPAGFPPVAPTKPAKTGPVALVLVLAAVVGLCVYFIVRSRFDGALAGNWQSTVTDGPVIWPRHWQVTSFGSFQDSESASDAGVMAVGANDNVRILRSPRLGNLDVTYRFAGQDIVYFTGPLLGPEGNREWTWSTVGRGVPSPGKFTFIGTWLTSAPQHGLTGSMTFTVASDASYKVTANYSGSGKIKAKGGSYSILSASGAVVDSGTYQASGANQIVFHSATGQNGMTWTRTQ